MQPTPSRIAILAQRALILSAIVIFLILVFHAWRNVHSVSEWTFVIAASLGTTLLLLTPAWLLQTLGRKIKSVAKSSHIAAIILYFVAILLVISDYKLYSLYGFHINSFVINLLLTPGGIESLGASDSFYITITAAITTAALGYFALTHFVAFERLFPGFLRRKRFWLAFFAVTFLGQAYAYALAEYKYERNTLIIAEDIAFYVPVTSKSLFKKLGIDKPPRPVGTTVSKRSGKLNYPLAPIEFQASVSTPNIIWLVAESWRYDMLDPEIMPITWQYAQENFQALQHYSGGNGTRMGMFSMFYSLHGSYWFDFLREKRQPVLFDTLNQLGYEKRAFTSAKFSYPEFDQTIFSGFRDDELITNNGGPGWKRDRRNVNELLKFLTHAEQPFFAFMFFESPHANYYFPDESVIRPNYLPDLNYATMDPKKDSLRIKNRYINASHHLDQQFGRILDYLDTSGQADNTIVIITGDHGEEFMEKGHWGHNSTFVQEQVSVPLVIAGPGIATQQLNRMSSHVDIVPTLLSQLGVINPFSDYGYGADMLSKDFQRQYSIVTDWHGPVLIGQHTKFNLSKRSVITGSPFTGINDELQDASDVTTADKALLRDYMKEHGRFYSGRL